ncbi:Uncharacterised protein [Mycobacteroides abscessus]|nr:Uncharacterised protein [Mycobacteroides abscessus]
MCPEGKLDVGGASSSRETSGRSRPTTIDDVRKISACSATASAGTRANHHCRVRHHTSATVRSVPPMMNSVVPMRESTSVTVSQNGVRRCSNHRLTATSPGRSPSGPVTRKPVATMTTHSTAPGRNARRPTSRSTSFAVGRVVSSS